MKEIHLNIQYNDDREAAILALANAGYEVKVKMEENNIGKVTYWVIFKIPALNIKSVK